MGKPSSCLVSFQDIYGIEHAVEVVAVSMFEAAALALAEFRRAKIVGPPPANVVELTVQVRPASVMTHKVKVKKVDEWLASHSQSPAEVGIGSRVREGMNQA